MIVEVLLTVSFSVLVVAFVTLPFWWFCVPALFSRATPLADLVCDMLGSDVGWSGTGDFPRHVTGIEIQAFDVESVKLSIGGQRAPLSGRDRWRLRRAAKAYAKRQALRSADQAAIKLADKVKEMASRVQAMAEIVVPMHRDRP